MDQNPLIATQQHDLFAHFAVKRHCFVRHLIMVAVKSETVVLVFNFRGRVSLKSAVEKSRIMHVSLVI